MGRLTHTNVAMTGSAVEWQVPAGTRAVSLQAVGGDISLGFTSTGDTRTIEDGDVFEEDDPNISRDTWYLTGSVGVTAEITYKSGTSA